MKNLIILRGNSGSGKSSVAKKLRHTLTQNVLLVEQDVVRIDMLAIKDHENNLAINLIKEIVLYGFEHCETVILEGILSSKNYEAMLQQLITAPNVKTHAYYFDVPFEETVRRHAIREKSSIFTEEDMRRWWHEKDLLHIIQETIIDEHSSLEQSVEQIIHQLYGKAKIKK